MSFTKNGFVVVPGIVPDSQCEALIRALPSTDAPGSRRLLSFGVYQDLAKTLRTHGNLAALIRDRVAVQCTLFQKSADRNWSVRLHRDRVIPVAGAGAWKATGEKEGMNTARPPREFLDDCVAVRVNLDGSPSEDLSVVPSSHMDETKHRREDAQAVAVPQGGALVMRPTLAHASSRIVENGFRRVLHYLFAPGELPDGYRWYYAV